MSENDPFLDDAMRGWIKNYAVNNFWRVASWYELEDLVQDGYLCYAKCRDYYKMFSGLRHPSQSDRRHFMSLVQTTFTNYIHGLAKKSGMNPEVAFSQLDVDLATLFPTQLGDANLRTLLASAPLEIVELVKLLSKEGADAAEFVRSRLSWRADGRRLRRYRRRLRETSNQHYCRRLGLDPDKIDLFDMLKNHLGLT